MVSERTQQLIRQGSWQGASAMGACTTEESHPTQLFKLFYKCGEGKAFMRISYSVQQKEKRSRQKPGQGDLPLVVHFSQPGPTSQRFPNLQSSTKRAGDQDSMQGIVEGAFCIPTLTNLRTAFLQCNSGRGWTPQHFCRKTGFKKVKTI